MPHKDVKKWYNSRPDVHKPMLENYQKLDASKMNAETRTKLEKLGGRMQKLQDNYNASTPLERHRGRSQDEIAKSYLDRIETAAAGKQGEAAVRSEINSMVKDLRLMAQSDKSNGTTYKNAMGSFKQVMNHKTQNSYSSGSRPTIAMADVIASAEKLEGPGSGAVKADLIEGMVQQKKEKQVAQLAKELPGLPKEMLKIMAENTENGQQALKKLEKYEKYAGQAKVAWNTMKQISAKIEDQPYPGAYVARLIKSDPTTMAREFQARAGENPTQKIVMDEALKSVYLAHRKNPDQAAEVVGGMLGATARELAEASRERPLDKEKIGELGRRSGFMLRSAQTMVETDKPGSRSPALSFSICPRS